DIRRLHQAIRYATQRAVNLTRQLLVFSRRQSLNPVAVDLRLLLGEARILITRAVSEAVDVALDVDEALWPVRVDVGELEASLLNLAVNARDAMPGGGRLVISASNVALEDAEAVRRKLAAGSYVRLTV